MDEHFLSAERDLLRIATAGSVDDGKSTLIGRLLYETQAIFTDHLAEIERASQRQGEVALNLALLTDGLRAERTQGITIDVAYRYFATKNRRFVIADTPGHMQYTRNMVTGMSTADVAIILLDASRGITEQTRRHAVLTALLRVPHLVVCVNKMDLVAYDESSFRPIEEEFGAFFHEVGTADITIIPVAALQGDNITVSSSLMPWYTGPTLLDALNTVPRAVARVGGSARFPVQWVSRPKVGAYDTRRTYAGTVAGGELRPGDAVVLQPVGLSTHINTIETFDGPIANASAPQSVNITLTDELDVDRGDLLSAAALPAVVGQCIEAIICWFAMTPLQMNGRYLLKHTTRTTRAVANALEYRLDIATLNHLPATALAMNDIGLVKLRTAIPLCYDSYTQNRITGSFILIDERTNETAGAGMII